LMEVIMLTGHATVESAIEGMKLGAFDYLMKPCEIEQLIAKVQEAAKKKETTKRKSGKPGSGRHFRPTVWNKTRTENIIIILLLCIP